MISDCQCIESIKGQNIQGFSHIKMNLMNGLRKKSNPLGIIRPRNGSEELRGISMLIENVEVFIVVLIE